MQRVILEFLHNRRFESSGFVNNLLQILMCCQEEAPDSPLECRENSRHHSSGFSQIPSYPPNSILDYVRTLLDLNIFCI